MLLFGDLLGLFIGCLLDLFIWLGLVVILLVTGVGFWCVCFVFVFVVCWWLRFASSLLQLCLMTWILRLWLVVLRLLCGWFVWFVDCVIFP